VAAGGDAERRIGVVELLLRRGAAGRSSAAGRRSQQRFEPSHVPFGQAQAASDAHEHGMLGRVYLPVGGDGRDLHLQEQLKQESHRRRADCTKRSTSASRSKSAAFPRWNAALAVCFCSGESCSPDEDLLGDRNLVARHDAVGLTERSHDREGRVEELRLHAEQPFFHGPLRDAAEHEANRGTHQETGHSAEPEPDQGTEENKRHDEGATLARWLGLTTAHCSDDAPGFRRGEAERAEREQHQPGGRRRA
jgi:hypothetical protein